MEICEFKRGLDSRKSIGTFTNIIVGVKRVFYTKCSIATSLITLGLKKINKKFVYYLLIELIYQLATLVLRKNKIAIVALSIWQKKKRKKKRLNKKQIVSKFKFNFQIY